MNIVFDLDGTLIDSAPDIQSVAATILNSIDKEALNLAETRRFIGEGAAVFVRRMMDARDIDESRHSHAALLEAFVAQYEFAVDKAVYYPGVYDTLLALKESGFALGLCTNKPELPARAVMRHMGMEALFDAVMAGGMIASHKPEPDMLLQTIESLGGGATLYVGDSEIDAETARRAAIPFALFSEGYRKTPVIEMHHDWTFDDYDALGDIVDAFRLKHG